MATRIYCVSDGDKVERLVRANSRSQAVAHVARSIFRSRVATQGDLETNLTAGVRVENAGEQVEKCESGDPSCGPVVTHDSEGVPLCQQCADELAAEAAQG